MRILIVSNYYPPFEHGGWEQNTRDVAERLRQRGHSVQIVTSTQGADSLAAPEPWVARVLHLESPDVAHYHPVYTLRVRARRRENLQSLDRVAAAFSPEVVFINGMWNLSSHVAAHLEELYPERVLYFMSSYWPAEPDAHSAYWALPALGPCTDL